MSSGWGGNFGAGSGPPPPSDRTTEVEYRTLTGDEITAKQIVLNFIPAVLDDTRVEVSGGTAAYYAQDFVVAGNVLSWTGLGLDGVLIAGDQLVIRYPIQVV